MSYGCSYLFIFLLTVLPSLVQAGISVDRSIIEFEPEGEYFTDISVFNSDPQKAYVSVSIYEVLNPGKSDEGKQSLIDPDKALLIATPSRLVLEPKQSTSVRLLNLDENQKTERIYRVLVEPVSGRLKGDVDGVKVLVSYELLVIVRPVKPNVSILAHRNGNTMTFYNNGNTSVYLESGRQCNPAKASECKDISGERLYAGASWQTELPWREGIEFTINTGGENTIKKYFEGKDTLPSDSPFTNR